MTVDPRTALDRLVAALEAHYGAVIARRGDDDPIVDDAYYVLADAFDVYDEVLGLAYGEALPLVLADDEDEDLSTLDEDDDVLDDDDDDDDEPEIEDDAIVVDSDQDDDDRRSVR